MPVITIRSPLPSGGKTSLAAGLLAYLYATGRRGAYYKPYSPTPEADADYQFFASPLAASPEDGGLGCLAGPPPVALGGRPRNLSATIDQLEAQAGFVIIELAQGTPPSRAPALRRARNLTIARYGQRPSGAGNESAAPESSPVASAGNESDPGESDPSGADASAAPESTPADSTAPDAAAPPVPPVDVLTAVPPHRLAAAAAAGVVALPESRTLLAPTVAQVAAHLDAEWVQEPVNAGALVERYLIGGNIMDSGPNYFARHRNQGLIVRAQRPDIQLAGMLPQTRCLVLTGPGETSGYIRAEARERDIPLLRVAAGTIATAEALEGLTAQATPHSPEKAHAIARLLQQHAAPTPLDEWLA